MSGSRFALTLAALLYVAPILSSPSSAEDDPSRPIKIIVPFGAGGPADVAARLLGNVLQESFGQPFVVENHTGAGGVIGTLEAVKWPAGGYTLLMMSNTQTANESLVPQRKYELMRDLVPIAPVNSSDLVIVVHPSVPANTLQEFIALAKSQPGKLNYASSGQGTPCHMAGELFKTMAGIDIVHVLYRRLTLPQAGRMAQVILEHAAILAGIEAHDPSAAHAAMESHLERLLRDISATQHINPQFSDPQG